MDFGSPGEARGDLQIIRVTRSFEDYEGLIRREEGDPYQELAVYEPGE